MSAQDYDDAAALNAQVIAALHTLAVLLVLLAGIVFGLWVGA